MGILRGCQSGAVVFNCGYAVALSLLSIALRSANVVLRLNVQDDPFWVSGEITGETHLVEVTFVDDLCIILVAERATDLRTAIDILMEVLLMTFGLMDLAINFAPAKTEAMLQFRGKQAVKLCSEFKHQDGRYLVIPPSEFLSDANPRIGLVHTYKHLGLPTAIDGSPMPAVNHNCNRAFQAYGPLASKVFGSPQIRVNAKILLMNTLILTRLCFNLHIMVPNAAALAKLNTAYMRPGRKIADRCNYDGSQGSDLRPRISIGVPSIDCLLLRRRLLHLRRILVDAPAVLPSLLAVRKAGALMPYTKLIIDDMKTFN